MYKRNGNEIEPAGVPNRAARVQASGVAEQVVEESVTAKENKIEPFDDENIGKDVALGGVS